MVNRIITDSFETLGGAVKSSGKQVKQVAKKMGDDIAEGIGLKQPLPESVEQEDKGSSTSAEEQYNKIRQTTQRKKAERYRKLQEEILQFGEKRKKEVERYREPGFTEGEKQKKQIQQLEEKAAPEKKLLPVSVQKAQKKVEIHRGVAG